MKRKEKHEIIDVLSVLLIGGGILFALLGLDVI